MDKRDLPPDMPVEEVWQEMLDRISVQRYIRENFGLYSPPADYAALRAENLRRSKAAQKG
jgi:hypothetical protein